MYCHNVLDKNFAQIPKAIGRKTKMRGRFRLISRCLNYCEFKRLFETFFRICKLHDNSLRVIILEVIVKKTVNGAHVTYCRVVVKSL